jgi:hypothetical protein
VSLSAAIATSLQRRLVKTVGRLIKTRPLLLVAARGKSPDAALFGGMLGKVSALALPHPGIWSPVLCRDQTCPDQPPYRDQPNCCSCRARIGQARGDEPVVLAVRPDVVNESGLLSLYLESERAVA